jgi:ABC-type nickel/cobalt efflux system permease component RcnA
MTHYNNILQVGIAMICLYQVIQSKGENMTKTDKIVERIVIGFLIAFGVYSVNLLISPEFNNLQNNIKVFVK